MTLLVGRQEGHPASKTEWWDAGVVMCLERGADLHMVQLMPLQLTGSCFSKIQIGFTFLVPAYLGSPGQRAVKEVCVRVRVTSLKNMITEFIYLTSALYGRCRCHCDAPRTCGHVVRCCRSQCCQCGRLKRLLRRHHHSRRDWRLPSDQ